MKDHIRHSFLIGLLGLMLCHCAGQESSGDLSAQLTGAAGLTLDKKDFDTMIERCGSDPVGGDSPTVTASFTTSTLKIKEKGSVLVSGTWEEVADHTIKVHVNGTTITAQVSVDGDSLKIDSSQCASSGGDRTTPFSASEPNLMPDWIKKGTWCYQSGDVSNDDYSAIEALIFDGENEIVFVRYVGFPQDYAVDELGFTDHHEGNSNHTFTLSAYRPWGSSGQLAVNADDTITQTYNAHHTVLKWTSANVVACPTVSSAFHGGATIP